MKGVEPTRRISFLARYIWLRVMDCVCWVRGYRLANFPKGRFCRRCCKVEGADFGSKWGRRLARRLWHRLRDHK